MIDVIRKGSTNQSVMFALTQNLAVTGFKLGYVRWSDGDGTSFTDSTAVAMTALASITTAHTDNYGIYLSSDTSEGSYFLFRADVPDAAFATGADRVAISVYDDGNNEIAHREFLLGDLKLNSLDITTQDSNKDAIKLTGNGTGHGLNAVGGASNGDGIHAEGGATNSSGIQAVGKGNQAGIIAQGGTTSGSGLECIGENGSGGIHAYMNSGNGAGIKATGLGSGKDFDATIDLDDVSGALAKGTELTGFNDLSAAQVNAEVDTALSDYDGPTKTEMDASFAALNDLSEAQVNAEVDAALADIHLDHLFAVDYDPAAKPGVATALLNEIIGNDAGVSQFTANALELAPTGGDATEAKQDAIITDLDDIKGTGFTKDTHSLTDITKATVYADGRIYVDTNASNTNTTDYVDGTIDNPVSTWAAALTLAGSLGIKKFHIANGSSIQLTANSDYYDFIGENWDLDPNSQSMEDVSIVGCRVMGDMTANTNDPKMINGTIGGGTNTNLTGSTVKRCGLRGQIILAEASDYHFDSCYNADTGTTEPIINFGASVASTTLFMHDYSGSMEIRQLGAVPTDVAYIHGRGQITLSSNCTGGTLYVYGNFSITDNSVGTSVVQLANTIPSNVVDEWENQSQADPTGFHVNVREWLDVAVQLSVATQYPTVDVSAISDSEAAANYLPNLNGDINDIQGTGFDTGTDSLEAIRDAIGGISGGTTPAAVWAYGARTLTDYSDGSGFSNIPWNSSWDAEVESECNDALVGLNLDHLLKVAVTGTDVTDDSVFAKLVSIAATADWDTYDNTTDSLEAIRLISAQIDGTCDSNAVNIGFIKTYTGTDIPNQINALNDLSVSDVETAITNSEPIAANVTYWNGSAVLTPDTAGAPKVTIKSGTGTGEINLNSGIADGNIKQIHDNATEASKLEDGMKGTVSALVAADAGNSQIQFKTNLTETTDDHYNGRIVTFISGALTGQSSDITDYDGTNKIIHVTALTETPSASDGFIIT